MRWAAIALGLLVVVPGVPLFARAGPSQVYQVTYGGRDLGAWSGVAQGKSTTGSYDGTSFESSGGPGFATVTLTRLLTAADRQSLWSSLPSGNGSLVVREMRGGATVSVMTCPKAMPDTFDASGNPGQATETLVFACTAIATANPPGGTK